MKSDFNQLTDEEKLETAKAMLRHSSEKVSKMIDQFTSSSLKKILKFTTHVHFAEAFLDKPIDRQLSEKEQKVIDYIFSLQEDVLAVRQMLDEMNTQDPLQPVDLAEKGEQNV